MSDWFAQQQDPAAYTKEHFETTVTAEDVALIRAMGFDHVRLSVDPRPMFHAEQSDQIASDDLTNLDAAMKMILDQGLAVELSIYADDNFKQKLATDDDAVERFADFWRALAAHYANLDPDRVFFEILNEPEGRDRYRWYGVEAKLATAIREGAPQHTIIATGAHWSDDDDLIFLEPLRDPNVIYTFHFYEPHIFTHQGADWSVNYWHYLRGVPYPSDPERARKAAELVPDPVHRLDVVRYGLEGWNAARIDAEIAQVDDWAKHWNVPVICNEFGVYRKYADPKDRAAWIADVRAVARKAQHRLGHVGLQRHLRPGHQGKRPHSARRSNHPRPRPHNTAPARQVAQSQAPPAPTLASRSTGISACCLWLWPGSTQALHAAKLELGVALVGQPLLAVPSFSLLRATLPHLTTHTPTAVASPQALCEDRKSMNPPYRAEHVGSLLRPAELLAARASYAEGKITEPELRAIEDRAILAALGRQRTVGLDVYTDGEMRRGSWLTDMADAVEGFVPAKVNLEWKGPGGGTEGSTANVVGAKAAQTPQNDRPRGPLPEENLAGPL